MSLSINYGGPHQPKLIRSITGTPSQRTTLKLPAKSSAAIYLGAFVPLIQGTDAAPAGAEFGIPAIADDNRVAGIVVGFTRDGVTPIQEDSKRNGTITDATGELPMKYTFSATNDQASTTSAKFEMVEILPIFAGDIIEVALFGASTASVARGTTTAYGTTLSSANMGVGMSINTTYHFALLESTAAKLLANLDFMTVLVDGQQPSNPNHVYAMCVRSAFNCVVPE